MSSAGDAPLLPLFAGIVYLGSGQPVVAGSFFVALLGTDAQLEYHSLEARFGKSETKAFFGRFDAFFNYVLTDDRPPIATRADIEPRPDPAVELPEFVAALRSAGTTGGGRFDVELLLGRLLTPNVRDRAYAHLDRTFGPGGAGAFRSVFGAIVGDASERSCYATATVLRPSTLAR